MQISGRLLIFIVTLFASTISAMQENFVIAPELMPQLDAWYSDKFLTSGIEKQREKAFKAASFNSPRLYYLLIKHPELACMQRDNGENLLSEIFRCRRHVTSNQAKFLLGCPFNLDPNIGTNTSIFYRVITFFQKDFMKELLRHANFKITQQHLDTINWIIGSNPYIPEDTMQWWLSIKNNLKSRLITVTK